jgi:hypothetical protein
MTNHQSSMERFSHASRNASRSTGRPAGPGVVVGLGRGMDARPVRRPRCGEGLTVSEVTPYVPTPSGEMTGLKTDDWARQKSRELLAELDGIGGQETVQQRAQLADWNMRARTLLAFAMARALCSRTE